MSSSQCPRDESGYLGCEETRSVRERERESYALNIDSDPLKQKVSVLLDTLRAWRTPQQHYKNGGSGAQCGDCNKDTRSCPCFDTCSVAV